jgi:hypothetical protein
VNVSDDQLLITLIGPGDVHDNSYVFCVNRAIDDVIHGVVGLKDVEGVEDFIKAERSTDEEGAGQTVIEVAFASYNDMPAVFGRIAFVFAHCVGVPYQQTRLARAAGARGTKSILSSMSLPDFCKKFPSTVGDMSEDGTREEQIIAWLEQSLIME